MRKLAAFVLVASALAMVVPAQATTILTDTFDRPDGTLGSGWQTLSSTWGVRSGQARMLTGQWTSTTAIAYVDTASTSYVVDVDITLSPTSRRANAAVALAVVDYSNNFFCKLEVTAGNPNGLASIGRRVGKTISSLLASAPNIGAVNGGTYHVRCGRQGNVIAMQVLGRTLTYTMSSSDLSRFGASTRVGFRTHLASDEDDGRSTYDSFRVTTDGTATEAIPPAPDPTEPPPAPDPTDAPPAPTETPPAPEPTETPPPEPTETPPPPEPQPTLRVVAISDICGSVNTNCKKTAALVAQLAPDFIVTAGDEQNTAGTLAEYMSIFHPAWGSLVPLMRPVPGNHEYNDPASGPGAEGYRAYFPDTYAPADGPLYHSFSEGAWHFVGIDSDKCSTHDAYGCPTIDQVTDAQYLWMVSDLASDTHTCDLVYGHHPAYSSPGSTGRHGSIGWMQPAWDAMVAAGVDLYLSGHDADYERFARMDANGARSPNGTRQFVIGTGGAGQLKFGSTVLSTSEFRWTGLGATVFDLADGSYSWTLYSIGGQVIDSGGPVPCS